MIHELILIEINGHQYITGSRLVAEFGSCQKHNEVYHLPKDNHSDRYGNPRIYLKDNDNGNADYQVEELLPTEEQLAKEARVDYQRRARVTIIDLTEAIIDFKNGDTAKLDAIEQKLNDIKIGVGQ